MTKSLLILKSSTLLLIASILNFPTLNAQQFVARDLSSPIIDNANNILCYGHFNNDNQVDFIAQRNGGILNNQLVMIINDGKFNGAPRAFDLENRKISTLKSGDINGDGLDDLVAYDQDSQEIIWYQSEYLNFRKRTILSEGTATGFIPKITVEDINTDGYADVIYNTGALARIRFGQANGLGVQKTIYSNRQENILLDYNNDGLLDLLYYSKNRIQIYIQTENKSFTAESLQLTDKDYNYGALINVDNDPELELVRSFVSQSTNTAGTTSKYDLVYFDSEDGVFSEIENTLLTNLDEVTYINHIDDSNANKIAMATYRRVKVGISFQVTTYINIYSLSDGSISLDKEFDQFDDYQYTEVIDIDKDGIDEILWSSNTAGIIGFYDDDYNLIATNPSNIKINDFVKVQHQDPNQDGTYILTDNINRNLFKLTEDKTNKYVLEEDNANLLLSGQGLSNLAASSFNNDDQIDFAFTNIILKDSKLYAAFSVGSSYEYKIIDDTKAAYRNIRIADFDQNGRNDILVSYGNSFQPVTSENKLVLYLNQGSMTFEKTVIDEDVIVGSVVLIHLNKNYDDLIDIVTNGYIYENNGNGDFTKTSSNALEGKAEIVAGDIDLDGIQDIISTQKIQYTSKYNLYFNKQLTDQTFSDQNIGQIPQLLGYDNSRNVILIDLVDLDGDGDLDLPIFYDRNTFGPDQAPSQLHWLENRLDDGFVSHIIDSEVELSKCQITNLDDDNTPDLLCRTNDGGLRGYFNTASKLKVFVNCFLDENLNGILDENENYYPDFQVSINGSSANQSNELYDGKVIYLDEGTYTISYDESYITDNELTTNSEVQINLSQSTNNSNILFGIKRSNTLAQFLQTATYGYPRCGKLIPLNIELKNNGSTPLNGEIILDLDPLIDEIQLIDDLNSDIEDNHVTYNVNDFNPGYTLRKQLKIRVPSIADGIELGDKMNIELTSNLTGMGEFITKSFDYSPEIRCSFDPNDKLSFPARSESKILFDEDIFYTIRFQNTGNDTAYNISIIDTLSENLNPASFELLSTSHRNNLEVAMDENIVHFRFKNIYLPDSNINEQASHGYVSFKIRAAENIKENTELKNKAYIFFDENPPVITNYTSNLLVSMLSVSTKNNELTEPIIITPNPSDGIFYIIDREGISKKVTVHDSTGKIVLKSNSKTSKLDLNNYQSGFYFIKFHDQDSNLLQTSKVILIN